MSTNAALAAFGDHVYRRAAAMLATAGQIAERWPDEVPYMMSFYVEDHEDEPRKPAVAMSFEYPPDRHDVEDQPGLLDRWRKDGEGRWNYASLSQDLNNLLGYDRDNTDREGVALIEAMLDGLDKDDCTKCFVSALVRVVQRLHRERFVERHLAQSIPLIIHHLESNKEVAVQNVEANGLDRASSFVDWIRDGYSGEKRIAFDQEIAAAQQAYDRAMR